MSRARVWIAFAALWLALYCIAAAIPLRWSWGLAYPGAALAGPAPTLLLALGTLVLLVSWMRLGWAGTSKSPRKFSQAPPSSAARKSARSPRWILPAAVAAGVLFWFFRGQTHYLGDGDNRLLAVSDLRGVYKAPFDYLVNFLWSRALGVALGGGLAAGQAWVSILSGMAVVLMLPGLLRGAGVPEGQRLWTGIVFLLSGWALLFFGYLEAYPVYLAALLFFLWLAFRFVRAGAAALILIPLWLILVGVHCQGLLMLPAAAYAVASGLKRGKWPGWGLLAAVAAVSLGLSALRVGNIALADHSWGVPGFLWSVFTYEARGGSGAGHSVRLLFAASRFNELALVWGPALTWLVFLWPHANADPGKVGDPPSPEATTLGLAALGGLGALLYGGTVGAARDWDLLAPSLVPAQLMFMAVAAQRMGVARRVILPASAALGLLHLAPWVWIQWNPDAGARWAGQLALEGTAVLRLIPHDRVDVAERLARQGKYALAGAILEGAEASDPAAVKLRRSAGRLRLATRNPAAAARDFEIVYHGGYRATGLQGLANVFAAYPGNHIPDVSLEAAARLLGRVDSAGIQQRWDEVLRLTGEGLAGRPTEPLLLRRRSYALLSLGRGDEAVEVARAGIVGDSTDTGGWESLALVLELLGQGQEAAAARARIPALEEPGAQSAKVQPGGESR